MVAGTVSAMGVIMNGSLDSRIRLNAVRTAILPAGTESTGEHWQHILLKLKAIPSKMNTATKLEPLNPNYPVFDEGVGRWRK